LGLLLYANENCEKKEDKVSEPETPDNEPEAKPEAEQPTTKKKKKKSIFDILKIPNMGDLFNEE
jgi:hypothetical protein